MGDDRPAPESYEDLRTAIALRFGQLSDRLQRIARHALAHPDTIALDTVAAIAQRAAVQPSSLIRFARAFGYTGFSDMPLPGGAADYDDIAASAASAARRLSRSCSRLLPASAAAASNAACASS